MEKRVLASNQLACVITYSGGYVDFDTIPQVGNYNHWNVKKVIPCQVVEGRYVDLRTDKPVEPAANSTVWPLLVGTVITYPDGQKLLLSRSCDRHDLLLVDMTDQPLPPTVTSLVAKN